MTKGYFRELSCRAEKSVLELLPPGVVDKERGTGVSATNLTWAQRRETGSGGMLAETTISIRLLGTVNLVPVVFWDPVGGDVGTGGGEVPRMAT